MPKILVRKESNKEKLSNKFKSTKIKTYYVNDISKDYHCSDGVIKKSDLKRKDGSRILSNIKKEFILISPSFVDDYMRIKRGAQIVSLKDIGIIIAFTGVNKNSKVVDAGAGSGALACFLANICKEVVTYEIRDDFYKLVKDNIRFLGLKNIKVKKKDVFKGIDEKDVDLVVLDLPSPWNALKSVGKALKIGGFLVSYSPTIPQVMDFVRVVNNSSSFIHLRTLEIIKRDWEVEERRVRPVTTQTVHTGFLTFCRRI